MIVALPCSLTQSNQVFLFRHTFFLSSQANQLYLPAKTQKMQGKLVATLGVSNNGFRNRYEEIFDVQMLDALIAAACHFVH
jgi:hypothetical protein